MSGLLTEVRELLDRARETLDDPDARSRLAAARTRVDEPLRVAIAGKVKAGKSTLLNALVGEPLAPTDAGECTRIVTWYRDGITYRVELTPVGGRPEQVPFRRDGHAVEVDLQGRSPEEVERLEVTWPSSRLREMTLIDTPGIGSLRLESGLAAADFLTPSDGRATEADAVVYLLRHLHGDDLRFLEAFHEDRVETTPVNAIGVLSRADELGAGKTDALSRAGRIASRYERDRRMRALVRRVVPVAGLLAEGAATLSTPDHRRVAAVAGLPADVREPLLLSADRFRRDDSSLPVTAVEREDLLVRLGLFGIRVAVSRLVDHPDTGASALASHLRERSGVERLREQLTTSFAGRRDVLKARAALVVLDQVLSEHPHAQLRREHERITAGAHELVEIRLMDALRAGRVQLDDERATAAELLLGGGSPARRLGLPDDADRDEVAAAALAAREAWQRHAEHPLSSRPLKEAAQALVRTCEGLMAAVRTGGARN